MNHDSKLTEPYNLAQLSPKPKLDPELRFTPLFSVKISLVLINFKILFSLFIAVRWTITPHTFRNISN